MTVVVPDPAPLDMPPGNAEALGELVHDVGGAAFWLAVLAEELTGPGASAPGWVGDDAMAAAAQVGVVAALARDTSAAVRTAAHRLSAHSERLHDARRQVTALRVEQDEDFAAAWGRLSRSGDYQLVAMTDGPEAVGIVEELEVTEAARRRRHAALLEGVADDAAATARVVAESCAVVGGRGTSGDAGRVLVYLAAQLPGWGDAELAARGQALADALMAPIRPERMDELAGDAAAYAGSPAFASALLAGLGVDGIGLLMETLPYDTLGPVDSVARLLAAALGAAVPTGRPHDPVGDVLSAVYVRPDDRYGVDDVRAAGMAAILAAGAYAPTGGPRMPTVAAWARQMLIREQAQGLGAGSGEVPSDWGPRLSDPAGLAIGILAAGGEPGPAARLLADGRVCEALLSRFWADGAAALSGVVALAGRESGAVGDRAVRTALEAVGAGLFEGDPADWTVNRPTVAAVTPALGEALAAHVAVAADALGVGVDGRLTEGRGDVLRGLGYLTLDRGAAAAVGEALHGWARVQPVALAGTSPSFPLPAVAVPSAYLAVQQYGQRLAYALHGYEEKEAAENRQAGWDCTIGLVVNLVSGRPGVGAGVIEGYAAILFGADGTWDNGADRGLVFDRGDAADAAVAGLPPDRAAEAVTRQARAAYDRTAAALGLPRPPTSPESDYLEPLLGGMPGAAGEYLKNLRGVRLP